MTSNNREVYLPKIPPKTKLLYFLGVLFCLYYIYFIFNRFNYLTFDIFQRIANGSYYVEASKLGPMLIIGTISFTLVATIMVFFIFDSLKKKTGELLVKIFIFNSLIAILGSFIIWPIINHQLSKHNYSYCFSYTKSNIASPPVYVKDPDYCFMGARSVRKELFAWFDQQEAAGVTLKPSEVKQKIDQLKEDKGTDW